MTPGPLQLIIVLVLVLLLFGRNKIPQLMGDVANGIKSFKKGMKEEENKELITRYEKVLKSFKKYYDHNRKQTDKYKNIINEIIQEDD